MVGGRVADDIRLGYKHQKVQRLRQLISRRSARDTAGVFVAEGFKLLEEGLNAGLTPEAIFVAPQTEHPVIQRAYDAGLNMYELEKGVMERVADTSTPQGVIVTFPFINTPLSTVTAPAVVLVDVRDPGNTGTILRSAEASGITAVIACEGTVDIYNPKVVRSSAGAIFHLPFVRTATIDEAMAHLASIGAVKIGTEMQATQPYDETDLTRNVALFFGNEANGLGEYLEQMDETVSIPITGRSESLNVSMAASILCFELARQKRAAA